MIKAPKISQLAYIRDLLKEEKLTDHNVSMILIKVESAIETSELDDYNRTKLVTYQQQISKFMYLTDKTSPEIVFVVQKLNKHNIDPQKGYLKVARQVVCYLKRTIYLELVYKQNSDRSLPISLRSH